MKNPLTSMRRTALPSQGPWKAMSELQNEMERWFGSGLSGVPELQSGIDFSPSVDLQETSKEYFFRFDIPGVKKEDVKIEVESSTLTVSGERRAEKEEKDAKRHLTETYYGSFMRSFSLPQIIDQSKVIAEYKDGILKITIPKTAPSNTKTVAIQ